MRSRPSLGADVDADALLAPVGVLEQHVHVAHGGHDPARGQATHGVATLGVLDLDDLGTPVGQDGRGGRHEGVLGNLEDANTFHDVCQRRLLPFACAVRCREPEKLRSFGRRCPTRLRRGPQPANPRSVMTCAVSSPERWCDPRRHPRPRLRGGSSPAGDRQRRAGQPGGDAGHGDIEQPAAACRAARRGMSCAAVRPVSGSATASAQNRGRVAVGPGDQAAGRRRVVAEADALRASRSGAPARPARSR